MATTISKLFVLLKGDASGLNATFKQASGNLKSFSRDAASIAVGFGAFRLIESAAGAITNWTKAAFEALDVAAKLADRTGIATEKLAGLQYAADLAGVDTDQLAGGLEKLLKVIGEAETGSDKAAAALEAVGVSVADLAGKSPDQVLAQVADGINAISDPAQKAAAAIDIFGKSGQGLLPFLQIGAEGMAAAEEEARKLGISFSRIDAAKVEAANDALTTLGYAAKGIGQQLAVELAPFITVAAQELTKFVAAGNATSSITTAVESVATGIAYLADYLALVNAGWQTLRAVGSGALYALQAPFLLLLKAGRALAEAMGVEVPANVQATIAAMEEFGTTAKDAADKALASVQTFAEGANQKAVAKSFEEINRKATEAGTAIANAAAANSTLQGAAAAAAAETAERVAQAADEIAKLQTAIDQFNMSEGQKQLADLAAAGATPEQLAQAQALIDTLERLQAAKDAQKEADKAAADAATKALDDQKRAAEDAAAALENDAKRVMEDVMTPAEKLQRELGRLRELLDAGAIDWETYTRAVDKANASMSQTNAGGGPAQAPELLQAGSSAVAELFASLEAKATGGDASKVAERQLDEAKTQTDVLTDIKTKLEQQAELTIVQF